MTWMDSAAIFTALLCQYECANSVDTADGYAMLASLTACATAHRLCCPVTIRVFRTVIRGLCCVLVGIF